MLGNPFADETLTMSYYSKVAKEIIEALLNSVGSLSYREPPTYPGAGAAASQSGFVAIAS
jgi:hypothetical protein